MTIISYLPERRACGCELDYNRPLTLSRIELIIP